MNLLSKNRNGNSYKYTYNGNHNQELTKCESGFIMVP